MNILSKLSIGSSVLLLSLFIVSCGEGESEDYFLKHDNYTRSYHLYLPKNYDESEGLPVLVHMHGYFLDLQQNLGNPVLESYADEKRFIIAYPKGVGTIDLSSETKASFLVAGGLNAGPGCCFPASQLNVDDVGFIRAMIGEIEEKFTIDSTRIYASGISSGSGMAFRLAVEASDVFAAIVGINMPYLLGYDNVKPKEPIATISFNGMKDYVVPINGGIGYGIVTGVGRMPPREENFAAFAKGNNCVGDPVETLNNAEKDLVCLTYKDCDGHAEVTQCKFEKANHYISTVLSPETYFYGNQLTWDLVSKYSK